MGPGTDGRTAALRDARLVSVRVLALSTALVALLAVASPAQATFPGGNGRIAFTWRTGGEGFENALTPQLVGVISIRLDGRGRRLIARNGTTPRYSPDGHRIAYLRASRLWVARADGEEARPVTPRGWLVGGDYDWSPRGTRLAFVRSFRHCCSAWLYTVKRDGTDLQHKLKTPQGLQLLPGAWSPDGKAIVYSQQRITARSLVRVVRAGRVTTVADPGGTASWSRRGPIAYGTPTTTGKLGGVCTTRADPRAAPRCLGFDDATLSDPSWSPDGRRLMVMYTPVSGPSGQLWTMRPDGTVLTRAPRDEEFPIFSPDGRRLAFSVARFGGEPRLGYSDLYTMALDGSARRRLVRGGQAQEPDWQPVPRPKRRRLTPSSGHRSPTESVP